MAKKSHKNKQAQKPNSNPVGNGEEKEVIVSLSEIKGVVGDSFKIKARLNLVIIFLLIIFSLSIIAEPVIYGKVLDLVIDAVTNNLTKTTWNTIWPLLIAWVMIDITGSICRAGAQMLGYTYANVVWLDFWDKGLSRVVNWDPDRFQNITIGSLGKKLDRLGESVWKLAGTTIRDILPPIIFVFGFFAVGLWIDPRMTIICVLGVIPLFLLTIFAQRAVEKRQDDMNSAWEHFHEKLVELFLNIIPIKSYAAEERFVTSHVALGESAMNRQQKVNWLWARLEFFTSISRFITRIVVFVSGIWFVIGGTLTTGEMVTFMGLTGTLLAPFDQILIEIMKRLAEIRSSFARVAPIWREENKINSPTPDQTVIVPPLTPLGVEFRKVSFKYHPDSSEALKSITFTVPAGGSLALVGPSGSGKSTIIKFINRFLDPTSGLVLVGGVKVKRWEIKSLRERVGVVHQDTTLFNDSIYNNIKFAKPTASKKEIISACVQAEADEFVRKMTNGYNTVIGERGVKLSGGEKQRIAIARVFLANPPILILDESTSALDSETEAKLKVTLAEVMKGRTTIMIAHRLSTIYLADQILVLENGKIVERGTHSELLAGEGLYERLWSLQSGGEL